LQLRAESVTETLTPFSEASTTTTTTVNVCTKVKMTLRQHCAVSGESISEVIRVAPKAHLEPREENTPASPGALGADYFGRRAGPAESIFCVNDRMRHGRMLEA
jgi:hypothetical protein